MIPEFMTGDPAVIGLAKPERYLPFETSCYAVLVMDGQPEWRS